MLWKHDPNLQISRAAELFMKIRSKYWFLLLFGLSVIGTPYVLHFWNHANDVRVAMFSGVLISSAAVWILGDDKVRWLPVFVIHINGWILLGISLVLGVFGDKHLLINLLPFGFLPVLLTWADTGRLWAENIPEN